MPEHVMIGPVRIDPEMRRDVDIMCTIRDMSLQDYVREALSDLIDRDRAAYPVGYQAIAEARKRLEEEEERHKRGA